MVNKGSRAVLALDIGGTKVHAALVTETGEILRQERASVMVGQGPAAFFRQLTELMARLSKDSHLLRVGIGSAGPLNPLTGDLLDPTNFFTDGKSWGKLSLLAPLKKEFPQWEFRLDNDAAAAALGEHWLGQNNVENLAVITLGTGVGVGVLVNGQLVRSREGLHPEASHIPLNFEEKKRPCGCGNNGCLEAYLAAPHFVNLLKQEWKTSDLTAEKLVQLAQSGDPRAHQAFARYGVWLAHAIKALAVLFGPQVISLSGGFATAAPWFLPTTEKVLPDLLKRYREGVDLLPQVKVSNLGDNLGVLGAACLVKS